MNGVRSRTISTNALFATTRLQATSHKPPPSPLPSVDENLAHIATKSTQSAGSSETVELTSQTFNSSEWYGETYSDGTLTPRYLDNVRMPSPTLDVALSVMDVEIPSSSLNWEFGVDLNTQPPCNPEHQHEHCTHVDPRIATPAP